MKKDYQKKSTPACTGRKAPKKEKPVAPSAPGDQDENLADSALPASVTLAIADLAETASEGLLALAVGTGLQVMQVMMEEDVTAVAGPKGKWNPERVAKRHGGGDGQVTLGGRRVPVRRPRVRSADDTKELAVPSYELFASTEILGRMALERMLAKLSTRRYQAGLEPVGTSVEAEARSTSRSAVSRRFVTATETALTEMMVVDLSGLELVGLLVDGVHFADHLCVVALGIAMDGTKHPLGVVEGSTENTTVVTDLLVGLRDRGLDVTLPILVVIDGAKALTGAVKSVFNHPVIQRCQLHKVRNVEAHLPKDVATTVTKKMRAAYADTDPLHAQAVLEALAETLTVLHLDVPPTLARTMRSTNAIESMIEICRDHATNVKRWRDGQMALRWCAAGMNEAAKQFRRVNGFMHLPALRAALDAHVAKGVTPSEYHQEKEVAA